MSFGAPVPMDEKRARAVLGDVVRQDGSLSSRHNGFVIAAGKRDRAAHLSGMFNPDQLEALAFLLRQDRAKS